MYQGSRYAEHVQGPQDLETSRCSGPRREELVQKGRVGSVGKVQDKHTKLRVNFKEQITLERLMVHIPSW